MESSYSSLNNFFVLFSLCSPAFPSKFQRIVLKDRFLFHYVHQNKTSIMLNLYRNAPNVVEKIGIDQKKNWS